MILQGGYIQQLYHKYSYDPNTVQPLNCRTYRILKIEDKNEPDRRDIVCIGKTRLIEIGKEEEVKKGTIVDFPKSLIHRVVKAFPSTLTLNCVFKNNKGIEYFDVFMSETNHGDPQKDRETVMSDKSHTIVSQIGDILNKVEVSNSNKEEKI